MRSNRSTVVTVLLAALVLAACDNPSGSGRQPVDEDDLVFLKVDENAPPLETYYAELVAVKGQDAELRIDYQTGEECVRFRLDDESLLRRPDGTLIRDGESVRIGVRVISGDSYRFEFSPAGLRFDPDEPAELRISYRYADEDRDDDGDVDDDDQDFAFGVWRQEAAGLPWVQIGSARLHDLDEVRADLDGFTQYALAGGNRSAR